MSVDRRGFAKSLTGVVGALAAGAKVTAASPNHGVPGQVLMESQPGRAPGAVIPEFLDCKNGKVWPNDRPGLGVSVDEKQLTFIEAMTEAAPGITHRRPDGSLTHW